MQTLLTWSYLITCLQCSSLIVVDVSPATLCWTSFPATRPFSTGESHQELAANEGTALETGLAPQAVINGP